MIITEKEIDSIIREMTVICDRLSELGCDSTRFIATANIKNEETVTLTAGGGNLFAQHGAVKNWLDGQRDIGTAHEIARAITDVEE